MTSVRVRPANVALVLGRGRSQEEVKLGEALGLAYLESALRTADPDREILLLNAIVDPELRAARTADLADARLAARRVAATDPTLCAYRWYTGTSATGPPRSPPRSRSWSRANRGPGDARR